MASVVVFLVALPLCLGIALASGVPPAAGLVTGIVGGLVVGVLAGSPLQVSGPAAGLAVLVLEIVRTYGLEALGPVVLLAGGLQLAAGLLRQGRWFRAVSPAVIQGMLAGIGVLILASQMHVMLDQRPPGSGFANLAGIPAAVWGGFADGDPTHHQAAAIGALTILAIVGWNLIPNERLRVIPGALVGVVLATVVANGFGFGISRVEVPASIVGELQLTSFESLRLLGDRALLLDAVALAVIASAETLLCATAVDQMHHGPRTHYDRELSAQGVGNLFCGFLGVLPMTGVIVRSSANVQAGGKTRLSAVLHGAWLLLFVAAVPWVLALVPIAALAAVLVYTGFKLVNVAAIKKLHGYGKGELAVYAATVLTIVFVDLLTGVLLGLALALGKLLRGASSLILTTQDLGEPGYCVRLGGAASFVSLPRLANTLESLPADAPIHVHTRDLRYIDPACLELLARFEERHAARGSHVRVEGWSELREKYERAHNLRPEPEPASCEALERGEIAAVPAFRRRKLVGARADR